jgi:exopolysaccharide biosynthesis protein
MLGSLEKKILMSESFIFKFMPFDIKYCSSKSSEYCSYRNLHAAICRSTMVYIFQVSSLLEVAKQFLDVSSR